MYKHPATLAVNVCAYDFNNLQPLKTNNLVPGLSVNYLKGFSKHFDLQAGITGAFPDSTFKDNTIKNNESFLLQFDLSLRTRFLKNTKAFHPYLLSGAGAFYHNKNGGSYLLAGPGIELSYKNIYFLLNTQYRLSLTGNLKNHYYYSFGVAGILSNPKRKQKKRTPVEAIIPLAPMLLDTDRDGVIDSLDMCPLQPGLERFNGCADTDGDGISDKEDKCPTVYGYLKYNGCAIADMDRDGISDEEDKCPNVPGIIKYYGCPVPDKDGDGVNDEEDLCIEVPGIKQLQGCPQISKEIFNEIDSAAKYIFFKTGSYELMPKSFEALDNVVRILNANNTISLVIEGHTDNVGSEKTNALLSENRAKTVADYLIKKGIINARLTAIGYGMQRPVSDNGSPEGRAKNRRVALQVTQ